MDMLISWLARFVHVAGAAIWVGGYAALVFGLIPRLGNGGGETMRAAALAVARIVSMAGVVTILGGLLLVAYTRGYGAIAGGEWGGNLIIGIVIAIALMGLGDGALRPAIKRAGPTALDAVAKARRFAMIGLVLSLIAIAIMTRMPYAPGRA